MTIDSKLTPQQIVDLSFAATASVLREIRTETRKWVSWSAPAVIRSLDCLYESFIREKTEFRFLCTGLDDAFIKALAFKKTEAEIMAWKSLVGTRSWWSSSVAKRADIIADRLQQDKKAFTKLCES